MGIGLGMGLGHNGHGNGHTNKVMESHPEGRDVHSQQD